MILPLVILIVLSLRIYQGLIKVRKNLNRHKRLVDKAENANERNETIAGGECNNLKVNNVIAEEDVAEGIVVLNSYMMDDNALNVFLSTIPLYKRVSKRRSSAGFIIVYHSSEIRVLFLMK